MRIAPFIQHFASCPMCPLCGAATVIVAEAIPQDAERSEERALFIQCSENYEHFLAEYNILPDGRIEWIDQDKIKSWE